KPVRPSQSSCLGIGVDEIMMSDLFHPGAQLSTGRHPIKNRLTEAELEAVGQLLWHMPDQGTLEQMFGPPIAEAIAWPDAQSQAQQPGIEVRTAQVAAGVIEKCGPERGAVDRFGEVANGVELLQGVVANLKMSQEIPAVRKRCSRAVV